MEIRGFRDEEPQRPGEVFGFAQPTLGNAGEKAVANGGGVRRILKHPGGQGGAEHRRGNRVDGDPQRPNPHPSARVMPSTADLLAQ